MTNGRLLYRICFGLIRILKEHYSDFIGIFPYDVPTMSLQSPKEVRTNSEEKLSKRGKTFLGLYTIMDI